jgi:hypothetical protein
MAVAVIPALGLTRRGGTSGVDAPA